jgi:dTDP-4-amino-4,6-dideoxygalactose transaminase
MTTLSSGRQLPLYQVHVPPGAERAIAEVLKSRQLAGGPHVARFESLLQSFIGNPRITATSDAASSLALSLYLGGVRPDDDVLASPMACLATNQPVLNLFARVRWCDIDPRTGGLDPDDVRRRITPRTRAILIYHWAGNPSDLDRLYAIAREQELSIIEDASESLGAEYGSRKLGNTGADFTVFSFYANRHLTTVEGGAIAFGSDEDYQRGRWLKRYGIHQPSFRDALGEINPDSDIPAAGWNIAMHEVAAALGAAQFEHLPEMLARHQANGAFYDRALAGVHGIRLLERPGHARPAYWVYTLLAKNRDGLLRTLRARGIQASKVHLRNDVYSCFGRPATDLPGVDFFQAHTLSIPCGWWINDEDRQYVVDCIQDACDCTAGSNHCGLRSGEFRRVADAA